MSGSNALLTVRRQPQNYLMEASDPVAALWASLPERGGGNAVNAPALTNPGVNVRDAERIGGMVAAPGTRNALAAYANLLTGFVGNTDPFRSGIRAYHGSPYRFDRFDMGKIGTGEGAQAYGHGLYFAGNERVARNYRDALARIETPEQAARAYLDNAGGNRDAAINQMMNHAMGGLGWPAKEMQVLREGLALLRNGGDVPNVAPGHMYEVNLRTSPDRLLDWDAPLSQQPMEVRNIATTVDRLNANSGISSQRVPVQTGRDVWQGMRNPRAAREMGYTNWSTSGPAEYLRDTGIDGIRYLDAGSRAAGEGSRNYVMFDDKLIDIIRRYGILPPALWGATQSGDGTQ